MTLPTPNISMVKHRPKMPILGAKKRKKKAATKLTNEFPMLSRRQHNTHVPRVSNNEAKGSLTIRPLCAFPSTSSLSTAGRPLRPEN